METQERKADKAEKLVTVYVNAEPKEVAKERMTFSEIVALASGLPTGPNILYSVTYQRGHAEQSTGTLVAGESVKVKEGMVFSVTATDRS